MPAALALSAFAMTAQAVDWEVGGFARSVGVVTQVDGVDGSVERSADVSARHRLLVTASGDTWELDAHFVVGGLWAGLTDSPRSVGIPAIGTADYLRWPGLSWGKAWGEKRYGVTAEIDRLALSWHPGLVDITVGRQPINLANTMLFTPHDVFAPFSPLDFFRAYKPGVDALKIEHEMMFGGPISSVRTAVIAAAGYFPTNLPDFDVEAELARSALLGRLAISTELADIFVLAGRAPWRWLAGLGAQADVGGWLLRLEHVTQAPLDGEAGFAGTMIVAGVMRSLTPDLQLMLEILGKRGEYRSDGGLLRLLQVPALDPWGANGLDKWLADRQREIFQGAGAVTWQAHPLVGLQGLLWYVDDDNVVLGNYTTWNFSDEGVAAGGFGVNVADSQDWFINAEVRWTW